MDAWGKAEQLAVSGRVSLRCRVPSTRTQWLPLGGTSAVPRFLGLGWPRAGCPPPPGREATEMAHEGAPLQRLGPCHVSPGSSPELREPSGRVGGPALLSPPPPVSAQCPPRSTEPHAEPSSVTGPHCQPHHGGGTCQGWWGWRFARGQCCLWRPPLCPCWLTLDEGHGEEEASRGTDWEKSAPFLP